MMHAIDRQPSGRNIYKKANLEEEKGMVLFWVTHREEWQGGEIAIPDGRNSKGESSCTLVGEILYKE